MELVELVPLHQHPVRLKQRFPRESAWLSSSDPKEVYEFWTLILFANAAGLHLDSPPTKRQPRMPDLECVIHGEKMLFELGEILESALAEGSSYSGKQSVKKMEALSRGDIKTANSIKTAGSRWYPRYGSLDRILGRKLMPDKYEKQGIPCYLVLFYNHQAHRGEPGELLDHLLQRQSEWASLIAGSVFHRVWIFDRYHEAIIGYLEVDGDGTLAAFHRTSIRQT